MQEQPKKTLAYLITYKIIKFKAQMKKFLWKSLRPSDRIQLAIAIGILATAIVTWQSIHQQAQFNRNLLRPWLSINPTAFSSVFTDSAMILKSKMSCFGASPVHNMKTVTVVLNNKDMPLEEMKKSFKPTRYNIMTPGHDFPMESIFPYKPFAPNAGKFIERLSEKSLFLLLYYEFTDFDNYSYYYYVLLSLDEIDTLINTCSFTVERSDTKVAK